MQSPADFWLQDRPGEKVCVYLCVLWRRQEILRMKCRVSFYLYLGCVMLKPEELACKSSSALAVITFQLAAFGFGGR